MVWAEVGGGENTDCGSPFPWGADLPWIVPLWAVASTVSTAAEFGPGLTPSLLHSRDASSGDWDTESCQTLETQAAHTRCQCQHLSTFAVLAQPPKDLVSGREVLGQSREEAPGLPRVLCDSVGRYLGESECVSVQVYLWSPMVTCVSRTPA